MVFPAHQEVLIVIKLRQSVDLGIGILLTLGVGIVRFTAMVFYLLQLVVSFIVGVVVKSALLGY